MFSATVAQKPTIAVKEGTKNTKNSDGVWKRLGALRTGPKPPARRVIHQSSRTPTLSMNGAPMPSRNFMVSMPFHTTTMFNSQNEKKHTQMDQEASATS